MCYLLVRQPLCLCHSQPQHWLFSQVSDGRSAEHETDPLPSAQGLNGTHAQTHTNMCALTDLSSVAERHGGDHSSSGSILTDRWVFYTKYYQAQLILLSYKVIMVKKICAAPVRIPLTWTCFFPPPATILWPPSKERHRHTSPRTFKMTF